MLNNKVIQIDSPHTSFNVRLIEKGDKYGRNDAITHDENEPLVEFFDVGILIRNLVNLSLGIIRAPLWRLKEG